MLILHGRQCSGVYLGQEMFRGRLTGECRGGMSGVGIVRGRCWDPRAGLQVSTCSGCDLSHHG